MSPLLNLLKDKEDVSCTLPPIKIAPKIVKAREETNKTPLVIKLEEKE